MEGIDLGALATIWLFAVIAATYIGDRADKGVLGFLLGLLFGPLGFLITMHLTGGLKVFPNDQHPEDD